MNESTCWKQAHSNLSYLDGGGFVWHLRRDLLHDLGGFIHGFNGERFPLGPVDGVTVHHEGEWVLQVLQEFHAGTAI